MYFNKGYVTYMYRCRGDLYSDGKSRPRFDCHSSVPVVEPRSFFCRANAEMIEQIVSIAVRHASLLPK